MTKNSLYYINKATSMSSRLFQAFLTAVTYVRDASNVMISTNGTVVTMYALDVLKTLKMAASLNPGHSVKNANDILRVRHVMKDTSLSLLRPRKALAPSQLVIG